MKAYLLTKKNIEEFCEKRASQQKKSTTEKVTGLGRRKLQEIVVRLVAWRLFLKCQDFGRMFNNSYSACALLSFFSSLSED